VELPDGQSIEGLLTLPGGHRPGAPVPLILNIHGGPANYFSEVFAGKPGIYPLATFASRGFAILQAQPPRLRRLRKSLPLRQPQRLGRERLPGHHGRRRPPHRRGVADPSRLFVMGWSYGGFMTSWIVTHTHRFRAAAIGAPVTNLWSFARHRRHPQLPSRLLRREPWELFERYRAHSPMAFVRGVETPSLILHGEADDRVPISRATSSTTPSNARRRSADGCLPRTPHGPQEPKFLADLMQRHLDWVNSHLPPAPR
jgi:dipeptidyl aminopeptidase/acylaminoacyl peptidase